MKALPIVVAAVVIVFAVLRRRGLVPGLPQPRRGASAGAPRLGVVGLVAGREFRQRVRGRPFRVATGLLLIGVAAAVVIPALTKGGGASTARVGVVGALTRTVRAVVVGAGASAGTGVQIVRERGVPAAERALESGRLDAAIADGRVLVAKADAAGDPLPSALAALLGLDRAIKDAGLRPKQASAIARARPVPVVAVERSAATDSTRRGTATACLIIIFILLTQYLTWTLIGVMEEKSSRVVEVLLATVRPLQLLAGKVVGIAGVVFAQAAAIAGFALVLGEAVGSSLLHGTAPLVLASALVWLVLGYAFYCWLYAAAGSTVERQDQVQTIALPLSLPMIVTYIAGITQLGSGSAATWFQVLAYLPPTAPFAMVTLVGLGMATWWQFALSAAISIAATAAVAGLAATVYRRAILRTGRRVPLREVVFPGRR